MSEKQNELRLIRMSDVAVEEIKFPIVPTAKSRLFRKTTTVLAIATAVVKRIFEMTKEVEQIQKSAQKILRERERE